MGCNATVHLVESYLSFGVQTQLHISYKFFLYFSDLPPTPVLRYANNLQNRSSQVEIVCEIPSPSSLINGYHLYRNGGEIASNQANRFTINYNLEFDGCYFCRSFVNILGQEILSNKSREVFLTLDGEIHLLPV